MTLAGIAPTISSAPQQATPLVPYNQSSGSSGLSFGDVLDTINPLQHIPILSGLYRAATGSQISPAAEIAGNTLYGALVPGGALVSLATSVADVAVKQVTGSDISQLVVKAVSGSPASTPATNTANASSTATPLVSNPQLMGTQAPMTPPPVPLSARLNGNQQASSAQYQRTQMLDALNAKLVKMAV